MERDPRDTMMSALRRSNISTPEQSSSSYAVKSPPERINIISNNTSPKGKMAPDANGSTNNVQCYNCNEFGHYSKNCPNVRKLNYSKGGPNNNVNNKKKFKEKPKKPSLNVTSIEDIHKKNIDKVNQTHQESKRSVVNHLTNISSFIENSNVWTLTKDDSDAYFSKIEMPRKIHMIRSRQLNHCDSNFSNEGLITESSATAGINVSTPEIIRLDQLQSILQMRGLTIRIMKIDNHYYMTKSDFRMIPISDNIFYRYEMQYGEDATVL
jgi:hypothetical protein